MRRVGLLVEHGEVILVHRYDVVKTLEVFLRDTPGANLGERLAAPGRRLLRAPVGRLADVVGMGACRFDVDQAVQSGLADDMAKDTFRGWRAADVAHAHEKYTYGCVLIHKPLFNLTFLSEHARRNPGVSGTSCGQNCTH